MPNDLTESEVKFCLFCGKEFTSQRFWARFCSKSCHDHHHRNEAREARTALREKRAALSKQPK